MTKMIQYQKVIQVVAGHSMALVLLACPLGLSSACGDDKPTMTEEVDVQVGEDVPETILADSDTADSTDVEVEVVCTEGTHLEAGRCESDLSWTEGTELSQGRDHHGTVVATVDGAAQLVIYGGWGGSAIIDRVDTAPIAADGTLGEFSEGSPLPFGLSGFGTTCIGDTIVVAGGMRQNNGLRIVASTLVGRVSAGGVTWTTGTDAPDAVFHASMTASADRFYLSGGFDGVGSVDTIAVATIGEDGVVSPWAKIQPLPKAMSHHSTFIHDGAFYIVGGLTGDAARNPISHKAVWRAPLDEDGELGAWESLEPLPDALTTHSSVVFNNYIWNFGGVRGNSVLVDQILRAELKPDGSIGAWESYEPGLPTARAHVHHTPIWGKHIYSVGGRTATAQAQRFVWTGAFE